MNVSTTWLDQAVKRIRSFAYASSRGKPPARPKIGLALGGGFARGIAHLGLLRVFEQAHIPIDYLAGTSVGALIAAAYAGGATLETMEQIGLSTRFKDFAEWTVSWQGLASDTRLQRYLRRMTPVRRFEELRIPLTIVATDLLTTEPVYFTKGEIGPALCASCAYPGLFRPVEQDGHLLVDGFLAAPVPVKAVREMGADFVIGVNLSSISREERPTNLFEIVSQAFSVLTHYSEAAWGPLTDLVIEPDVSAFRWDDFPKTPELIAAGERAAREALPQILAALQQSQPAAAAGTSSSHS
ncbi:MAG TPA: patatin-like phospholipase family protein [Patescibacteria group bacterium]|nr:patatin-like phospholipase family protein [Patescibacteria group bacterium]